MAHLLEDVIEVISRPPAERSEADVNGVLPWLRRRTELLPQLDMDTVTEVVRHCSYENVEQDDVILRQGDEADRMYIILRGSISVFIDASMTGEEDGGLQFASPVGSPSGGEKWKLLDRSIYGRFIIKYESGKQFGEAALIGEDSTRNATILADERCDLLVIHKKLFDRYLKSHQQKEFQLLQTFVEHHPLFSHMSAKFKRLLELSLRREDFLFDSTIVTQGQRLHSLYFIIRGQANILVEPSKHQKQYNHLWPFEVSSDIYAQEFEWLRRAQRKSKGKGRRESRRAAILRQHEPDPTVWPTKSDSLVVKRTEGYAASERMLHDKFVVLCSVQDGEVLGDAELVSSLSSHMYTVVCTSNVQTLVLDIKNLDRVTGRRNTLTLQLLKEGVVDKLVVRKGSQHGHQVPFLHFLHAKLTEEELPERKALPPLKTTKALPSKEVQTQHRLERYVQGKAELVEPCVPGSLIYKDMMEEKARIRSNIRRRSNIGINAMLRDARRKMNRRKPRSRREIVESLKEMIEAELVDASDGPQKGQQQQQQNKNASSNKGPGDPFPKPPGLTPRRPSQADSVKSTSSDTPRRPSLTGDGPPRKPSLTGETTPRRNSLTGETTPRRGSLTGEVPAPRKPLLQGESPRNGKDPLKKSALAKTKTGAEVGVKKKVTLPPLEASPRKPHQDTPRGDSNPKPNKVQLKPIKGPDTPRARSHSKGDASLPQIIEEREETMESGRDSSEPSAVSSAQSQYVKREVRASSDGVTPPSGSAKRMPPLAKVELRRPGHVPSDRWSMALKFVNQRMHDSFTEQLLSDGADSPTVKDYETSENSLQLLESRIKQFHVKYGEFSPVRLNLKLPKLRRFKLDLEDENQRLPKPGGKVWIKKRLCQIANSKFKVKGHEHIRYHMVPELPEFDKVKKMQTVMQQMMDNSVLKKQEAEEMAEKARRRFGNGAGLIGAGLSSTQDTSSETVLLPSLSSDPRASLV